MSDIRVGTQVDVVSGPHQGRAGRVLQFRDIALDNREPETYAVVEYAETNCFKEVQVDHISVPVRRLAPRS